MRYDDERPNRNWKGLACYLGGIAYVAIGFTANAIWPASGIYFYAAPFVAILASLFVVIGWAIYTNNM